MATIAWQGPSSAARSGNWNTAANWTGGALPGTGDDAALPSLGPDYTVTLSGGATDDVAGLTLAADATVAITQASDLVVQGAIDPASPGNGGTITLTDDSTLELADSSPPGPTGGTSDPAIAVRFGDATASTLRLDRVSYAAAMEPTSPDLFAGTVYGFTGANLIELGTPYAAIPSTLSYFDDFNGTGVLTVTATLPAGGPGPSGPVDVADITFNGNYIAQNFKLVDDAGQLAIAYNGTVIGPSAGHATLYGGPGDDLIIAIGADNTIYGVGGSMATGGGNDIIHAGNGGGATVYEGADQFFKYTDTAGQNVQIFLGGSGNTVIGGDENFTITLWSGGSSSVTLGDGNSTISMYGAGNTITVGTGTNVIGTGPDATVNITGSTQPDGPDGYQDTIAFIGSDNTLNVTAGQRYPFGGVLTVTGGTGGGNFNLAWADATLVTSGLYNVVSAGLGTTDISPGTGYDTVNLLTGGPFGNAAGTQTVHLAGVDNTVSGMTDQATITGGSGYGTFDLQGTDDEQTLPLVSIDTGGAHNSFQLLAVSAAVATGSGGYASVQLFAGTDAISFGGTHNSLLAGDDTLTVTGGTGYASYILQGGQDTIAAGGEFNRIRLQGTQGTVDAGSGNDTVFLDAGNVAITLHNGGNMVFLASGGGSIDDLGNGLSVSVAPSIGAETITGLATDRHAVIDLTGGAGGFTTPQQVVAALVSDGAGGSLLHLGPGSIDFALATGLTAANFRIG